jgi:Ser/Thr protein kinase RdoA (MazF antagonist)
MQDHPFAVGRTAEIFAWDDGRVLKLYRDWCPPNWVEYELRIGRIVQDAGLPVPRIGDLVEVNGRRGVIYERIEGASMLVALRAKPWTIFRTARQFAELHVAMHKCVVPDDLPTQRAAFERSIHAAPDLPDDLRDAALRALATMPDGNQLCHGDFHPDNIMMTTRGPIVIDWMTATRGNPLADVARTLLLLTSGEPPSPIDRWMVKLLRRQFIAGYLKRYFELCHRADAQLAAWRPLIAAARLNEKIPGEQAHLLAVVRAGLAWTQTLALA